MYELVRDPATALLRPCDSCGAITTEENRGSVGGLAKVCPLCSMVLHSKCPSAPVASIDGEVVWQGHGPPPLDIERKVTDIMLWRLCTMCRLWFAGGTGAAVARQREPGDDAPAGVGEQAQQASTAGEMGLQGLERAPCLG